MKNPREDDWNSYLSGLPDFVCGRGKRTVMISNTGHCKVGHYPSGFRWIAISPVCGFLVIITLLFLLGTATFSFAGDSGVAWSNLSPEQKKVLNRYSNQWDKLREYEYKLDPGLLPPLPP